MFSRFSLKLIDIIIELVSKFATLGLVFIGPSYIATKNITLLGGMHTIKEKISGETLLMRNVFIYMHLHHARL